MDDCDLCKAEPYEDCDPDCTNYDMRWEEVNLLFSESLVDETFTREDTAWR